MSIGRLIRGGTILDGTGREPYPADVAIVEGRIQQIGRVSPGDDWSSIDATGLFVTPSFIDVHSHSDFTLMVDPRAMSSITQGVTLEVIGNCGHGCAPIRDLELAKSNIYGYDEAYPVEWRTMAEYLPVMGKRPPIFPIEEAKAVSGKAAFANRITSSGRAARSMGPMSTLRLPVPTFSRRCWIL